MKAAESLFALAACRLSSPEGTQRHGIAGFLPVHTTQRLFPDLPGIVPVMIDLVQGKEAPLDVEFAGQRFVNRVEPLRGPIDVRSHIVIVDVKLDHTVLQF
jgi:hypothetical protein